jgi:hypothetical protein
MQLLKAWCDTLDDTGALNFASVVIKDPRNGWVLFSEAYLNSVTSFVRGYSNTIGSASTTGVVDDVVHRIRLKYAKTLVAAFLKQKAKSEKGKAAKSNTQALSALQERAIKQAVEYDKLVKAHKSTKNGALCSEVEIGMLAQQRGVSAKNSSGITYNWEKGSPAVPPSRATANAPVTASSKRNSHDASIFSPDRPDRDPSTLKRAHVAASRNKSRYVDSVSGGGGPDDRIKGTLDSLIRQLNNEVASSGDQSRQDAGSAGIPAVAPAAAATATANAELMTFLQGRYERLSNCRKEAHNIGDKVEVEEYSTKMKKIQKQLDELEMAQLDTLRNNAAAAAAAATADNH